MKAKQWKKINSTELLNHPRMQIVEDTVELPNGRKTDYIRYTYASTHSVAVIAINDKQEMLIQKEYSYPPDQIMWQLPGGGMKHDEDIIVAANRELSEESGFIGNVCKKIGSFYVDNRRSNMKQYVVLCRDLESKAGQRDEEEFIETYWVPISRLRFMVASGEFNNVCLLAALHIYFIQAEGMTVGK